MEVATLTAEDIPALVAIEANYPFNPWTKAMFLDAMASGCRSVGIKRGDQVIAYAVMSVVLDTAELLSIGVDMPYQRQGYGQQLMEYFVNYATEHHCREAFLEVHVNNHQAIRFYEKMGWQYINTRKNYYQRCNPPADAWVFRLTC